MSDLDGVGINIQSTYGALLAGSFLSCIIWGMSCIQLFWYFHNNESDKKPIKIFVIVLWLFDTAGLILILEALWPVLILEWGRVAALSEVRTDMLHHAWVSGIVTAGVQLYYLHRIYVFSGGRWLIPSILAIMAMYQPFVIIPFFVVLQRNYKLETLTNPSLLALDISLRSVTVVIDVFITVTMSYHLLKKGVPKFSSSRKMFFRLFLLTINTGFWTSLLAILDLALMTSGKGKTLYYTIFEWPLGSLYLSVLLVNFNSRDYVRGQTRTHVWSGNPVSNPSGPSAPKGIYGSSKTTSYSADGSMPLAYHKDTIMMVNMRTDHVETTDEMGSSVDIKHSELMT